jgi:hypothetical protein
VTFSFFRVLEPTALASNGGDGRHCNKEAVQIFLRLAAGVAPRSPVFSGATVLVSVVHLTQKKVAHGLNGKVNLELCTGTNWNPPPSPSRPYFARKRRAEHGIVPVLVYRCKRS